MLAGGSHEVALWLPAWGAQTGGGDARYWYGRACCGTRGGAPGRGLNVATNLEQANGVSERSWGEGGTERRAGGGGGARRKRRRRIRRSDGGGGAGQGCPGGSRGPRGGGRIGRREGGEGRAATGLTGGDLTQKWGSKEGGGVPCLLPGHGCWMRVCRVRMTWRRVRGGYASERLLARHSERTRKATAVAAAAAVAACAAVAADVCAWAQPPPQEDKGEGQAPQGSNSSSSRSRIRSRDDATGQECQSGTFIGADLYMQFRGKGASGPNEGTPPQHLGGAAGTLMMEVHGEV